MPPGKLATIRARQSENKRVAEPPQFAARSREALRRRYRPASIRLLFIGEAPPASGRFFYRGDSGLYRAMREAFTAADPRFDSPDFLAAFRDSGCYLIDLCPDPVDRLPASERLAARIAAEGRLARTLRRLRPQSIAILLRSIEPNVWRAAALANWTGAAICLPYPGRWSGHKKVFAAGLAAHLADGCRLDLTAAG